LTLVLAAVVPHGDLAVPELCDAGTRTLAAATQRAMTALGELARQAAPDVAVIVSPHHLHLERSFGVVIAGRIAGELTASESGVGVGSDGEDAGTSAGAAPGRIELDCAVDRAFARELIDSIAEAGLPVTGVSYGGNVPDEAVMPMDWGTLIPLWYLGGRRDPPVSVVLLTPARDLEPEAHVDAGRVIGRLAASSPKRVLFIASADQSHTHAADGPYGGNSAAQQFDQLVVDAIRAGDLRTLRTVPAPLIEAAKPDAWWQLLMLDGVLEQTADQRWRYELLAYEAPTYYGMATAAFTPGRSEAETAATR
jgi:aromatic ring-opening dioxygenase LigB subunit